MNIIQAIRTGRLFEAQEMIREGLKRNMLKTVHGTCRPVMKEAYGGPGAGVLEDDDIAYSDDNDSGDLEEDAKSIVESLLNEERTREDWTAYLGSMHASIEHLKAQIQLDTQQMNQMRKTKKDTTKKSASIAKKKAILQKKQTRFQDANKRFREWTQKQATKKSKAVTPKV